MPEGFIQQKYTSFPPDDIAIVYGARCFNAEDLFNIYIFRQGSMEIALFHRHSCELFIEARQVASQVLIGFFFRGYSLKTQLFSQTVLKSTEGPFYPSLGLRRMGMLDPYP